MQDQQDSRQVKVAWIIQFAVTRFCTYETQLNDPSKVMHRTLRSGVTRVSGVREIGRSFALWNCENFITLYS